MAEQQGFQQGCVCVLPDYGVIRASGDDARHFLHNQLTNDVDSLGNGDACLAGYCSPKGRLLATLLVWAVDDGLMLMLPKSLLPGFQKRLQMFVLRAKVKLEDVSESLAVSGIALPAQPGMPSLLSLPDALYRGQLLAGGVLIRVPDASGLRRALWIGPAAQRETWAATLPTGLPQGTDADWRWLDIQAGVPQVLEATREQFVPQMVNFELIGGVNFRKGCYPGQEIVARSQYLGKLKRRMLLATVDVGGADDAAAAPGTEVFADTDPGQPCGMIVNAERGPDGRIACLVEMKMDAAGAKVHLGSASGPVLAFGILPYALEAAN